MFLLGANDHAANEHSGCAGMRGLRGEDVTPKKHVEPCSNMAQADEVAIKIRTSQTDQYNRGDY